MPDVETQKPPPPIDQIRTINHHLRVAIDRVSDGVLIVEPEPLAEPGPRIVFANIAARKITGYKIEDLLGQPIAMLYDPEKLNDLLVRLPAVAETGKTYQLENRTACASGRKDLRWTVTGMKDGQGQTQNYLFTIFPEPVSALAAAAESARTAAAEPEAKPEAEVETEPVEEPEDVTRDQLQASRMESLALVAGGIAHDFNNILTTVLANLSLAKLETPINTELRQYINDAADASDNAKGLIRELLSFARGNETERREANIARLVVEAVRLSTYGANVKCETSIAPNLWSSEVDATQIMQVFNNLLINARQAMPKGGVIQVGAENKMILDGEDSLEPGPYVVVTVRDRGCGIQEDDLARIFDPFFTTKSEGTGLGLATCRSLVQKHHGTMTVRSKVNVGTEFKVFLPATGRQGGDEPEDGRRMLRPGQGTILVVDDQESVLAVASAILNKLGYDPVTAISGEDAVRIYAERMRTGDPVGAVLMDMTLPGGLSGPETMQELLKVDPEARAIATSGYFDGASREGVAALGFSGLLPKPYSAEALSEVLHEVMEARSAG